MVPLAKISQRCGGGLTRELHELCDDDCKHVLHGQIRSAGVLSVEGSVQQKTQALHWVNTHNPVLTVYGCEDHHKHNAFSSPLLLTHPSLLNASPQP